MLRELSLALRAFGSTHEMIAKRVGLSRPEVSAIFSGDAPRFSIERVLALLRRVGRDVNINITDLGRGGSVNGESIGDLGLERIPIMSTPGLTLIGGEDEDLRNKLLAAILREHQRRGDRAVLFRQESSADGLATLRFGAIRDKDMTVPYHSDADLPQREAIGATVVGLDLIAKSGVCPWTALHFAKDARVYGSLVSQNGLYEGQRVVDAFMKLLEPPRVAGYWKAVNKLLDTVIVPRQCYPLAGVVMRIVATVAKVSPEMEKIADVIFDGEADEQALITHGLVRPPNSTRQLIDLRTFEEAREFLTDLATRFDDEFSVGPLAVRSQKELEIDVSDRHSSAQVTIATSWSSPSSRYGVILVTEEPDNLIASTTPTTSLMTAPIDSAYLKDYTCSFLRRFSAKGQQM